MTNENEHLQPESNETELKATPETESGAPSEIEAAVETESETPVEAAAVEDETAAVEAENEAEPEAQAESEAEEHVEAAAEDKAEAAEAEVKPKAEAKTEAESEDNPDAEAEFNPESRPPAKLERLQKILAKAGVSSRRSAEALIEQGRVQVNGKVVTELGTKADGGRDHIRVDGKLLQGAERLRYFVLNKPKGFVTTVKDPEGRPTVMQFFDKMKERLYPVGRLDYMSEGLLVVTNDGELANRLTKAGSGVQKTYLVKVAGQPSEAELDILRSGVSIERGKPGSPQVRTSPARIRQVRQGDNPWYEVILIEGRNRELRKMFEEIGHFVEKIRRIGYGPLVLDQEPGSMREMEPEELEALRKSAEGKLHTPKAKELRRRNAADSGLLPTVRPKPSSHPRPPKPTEAIHFEDRPAATGRPSAYRPRKAYDRGAAPHGTDSRSQDRPRTSRPTTRPADGESRPAYGRTSAPRPVRSYDRSASDRPRSGSTRQGSTGTGRTGAGRPFTAKPTWKKTERPERPTYNRPAAPRRDAPVFDQDLGPVKPPNLRIEEIPAERFSATRSSAPRYGSNRSGSARPSTGKPFRSTGGLARPYTTSSGVPRAGGARPSSKPGREGRTGAPRTYGSAAGRSTSGARPSFGQHAGSDSRPSYGAKRPYGANSAGRSSTGPAQRSFHRDDRGGSFAPRSPRPSTSGARPSGSSRPYTPRTEGASDYRPTSARPYPNSTSRAERKAGPGWKPKSNFGGPGRPASGSHSAPRPSGFSKSGYKGKPTGSGGKRTGPRPGGKKRS